MNLIRKIKYKILEFPLYQLVDIFAILLCIICWRQRCLCLLWIRITQKQMKQGFSRAKLRVQSTPTLPPPSSIVNKAWWWQPTNYIVQCTLHTMHINDKFRKKVKIVFLLNLELLVSLKFGKKQTRKQLYIEFISGVIEYGMQPLHLKTILINISDWHFGVFEIKP